MRHPSAAQLGAEKFVALTTFKRDGEGVSTPMWIAREGSELLAWTHADSWKVKRVRRDPRVTLVPCNRVGKVADGDQHVVGQAEVVADPTRVARVEEMIRRKYGLQYRAVTFVERIAALGRRKDRVALTIVLDEECGQP
jgi:uncharacterized protein